MPAREGKKKLFDQLGAAARQAFHEHKSAPVVLPSGGNLPAGIENGIAQLVECKITTIAEGKQNAGKLLFYAAGIVKRPTEFGGLPIAGLRTQISEPLYHTEGRSRETVDQHLAHVLNILKLLGAEEELAAMEDEDELETVMEELKVRAPHFRFRTWSGSKQEIIEKNGKFHVHDGRTTSGGFKSIEALKQAYKYAGSEPLVNHTWSAAIEWVDPEANGSAGVEDETGEQEPGATVDEETGEELGAPEEFPDEEPALPEPTSPPKPGKGKTPPPATSKNGPPTKAKKPAPEPEPEPEAEEEAGEDLEALGEAADGGDEDAQLRLGQLAQEAGLSSKQVTGSATWGAVVELIQAKSTAVEGGEEEEAGEEEEEETGITLGDTVRYQPLDPKTKKPQVDAKKKPVYYECEVTLLDEENGVVNLKQLENPKIIYKGIALEQLLPVE